MAPRPFRYGILAKLVIGTFLTFFLLLRVEGFTGGSGLSCSSTESGGLLCCTQPKSRIVDTNKLFKVAMDIPGVQPEDLEVSVDNESRVVTLVGNRRNDDGDLVGCFQKSFTLDDEVDIESLVMQHDNGVLTVWSPKESDSIVRGRRESPMKREGAKSKVAFIRGSPKTQATTGVTRIKPVDTTSHMQRIEDPILSEEDPMVVEPIAYDEQEFVSVLTDDEGEHWFQPM